MAIAGRKPKASETHERNGNPGKRPLRAAPKIRDGVPTCPAQLDEEAREEWDRLVPILREAGVLKLTDRAALAGYCAIWSRWLKAHAEVQKFGMVMKASTGTIIQSPWLNIETCALSQLIKYEAELGLTPSSRSRVFGETGGGLQVPVDEFEKWSQQPGAVQ